MALNATTLSGAMRSAMLSASGLNAVDGPELTALCDAIASAVVDHITTSAVVNITVTGAGGPPPGGPVTGTGVGTVS